MSSFQLVLSDSQREFVDAEVARGGFASANDYLLGLLDEAQKRSAWKKAEDLVVEGLESGPAIELSPTYWQKKKQKLIRKYPLTQGT